MQTRLIQLTASRVFLGQCVLQIPAHCPPIRIAGIVAHGGATARLLSARMAFPAIRGTGLAAPYVSPLPERDLTADDIPLSGDLYAALQADGYQF